MRTNEKPALTRLDRIARTVALLAWAWFTVAIAWGMFGRAASGHYASMAATGIIGENMVIWKINGAVWSYFHTAPGYGEYFCHHPYGNFWAAALCIAVLGHHDWVIVLPAVAMSSATVLLVWSVVRHRYGYVPAAASACAWAVMPIALSFGNFLNLETMVMFGIALFFWGQDRMLATWKRRYLFASVAGVFIATTGDWPGYVGVAALLGWGLCRAFVLPEWITERIRIAVYARWWALSTAMAFVTFLFIVWSFRRADKLGDWLGSAITRGDDGMPLAKALGNRHTWIEVMFTPVAILVGKLALPVCLGWVIVRRRDADVYSLAAWAMAVFQYIFFKKGADVHIFWPHYFALYYSLALAQVTATIAWLVEWLVARWRPGPARFAGGITGAVVFLVPCVMMAPDAVRVLRWGRQSGGRFNNNATGLNTATPFRTEGDALFVVGWLRQELGKDMVAKTTIDVSNSQSWGWEHEWEYGGMARRQDVPAPPGPQNWDHPYFVARGSVIGSEGMKKVAAIGHVRAYGDIWVVDQREAQAPPDVYSLGEHAPGPLAWYFVWGAEPARSIPASPDPWLTWELRDHLEIEPAIEPPGEPATLEQQRVAYNLAIERGDAQRAERLRERIDAQIDRTVATRYDDGTALVGVLVTPGSQPTLEAWFEAGGPITSDAYFAVKSQVIARDPLSSIPADDVARDLSFQPLLATRLWKKGFLYHHDTILLHRIGVERFTGAFLGGGPRRVDGQPATVLLTSRY